MHHEAAHTEESSDKEGPWGAEAGQWGGDVLPILYVASSSRERRRRPASERDVRLEDDPEGYALRLVRSRQHIELAAA